LFVCLFIYLEMTFFAHKAKVLKQSTTLQAAANFFLFEKFLSRFRAKKDVCLLTAAVLLS